MELGATKRYLGVCKGILFSVGIAFVLNYLLRNVGVMTICAGVCLFLFSILLLEQSFRLLSGKILDRFLALVANKNWKSFSFGFVLSTLVQSSGLVTVIAVSFLSAGLLSLSSGVAMVYGINLSAACTTWIVGYFGLQAKISLYAMPFIIVGVLLYLIKDSQIKGIGLFCLSLGLLFLGISWMKEGFETFKNTWDLSEFFIPGIQGIMIYALIGLAATAVTQSSHATYTLAITALSVGQLNLHTALGVAIGAEVGSTIFTIIGSYSANIEGKKIAATHVCFKLLCALLALTFFNQYLKLTSIIAPFIGVELSDNVYQLAIFMSIFNLVGIMLLTPFIKQTCVLLNRLMPSKVQLETQDTPLYLNDEALAYATSAIQSLEKEIRRLLDNTLEIVARMIGVTPEEIASDTSAYELIKNSKEPQPENFPELYERKFKRLYSEIIDYGVRASTAQGITPERLVLLSDLRRACIIMAAAVKKSQQLHTNVLKYGYCSNDPLREEYNHIRRNLIRVIRLVADIRNANTPESFDVALKRFKDLKNKFDAISSNSLDSLIRNRQISDSVATSVMNDNATSRSIAKNLRHVTEIMTRTQESLDD